MLFVRGDAKVVGVSTAEGSRARCVSFGDVGFLFILARACLADRFGAQVFALLHVLSFAVLQGMIWIVWARDLEPAEESLVEDEMRGHFLALSLRPPNKHSSKSGVDNGVLRLLVILVPCWLF